MHAGHQLLVLGEGLQAGVLAKAAEDLRVVAERAVAEGDVIESCDPRDVAQVLLTMYLGLRQAADLDDPAAFLGQFERSWALLLPGMVPADRVEYFRQFIRRRTALAIKSASAQDDPAASVGAAG